ncbi:hypothetical protein CKF54_02605 [Psittacicella hinzii]|uniref:Uncharacterized protein n=1 Tax=Psittacicella hinzii TaxID=2028575 RepID=A0A3A1Y8I2_9GAMM|nr:hypothetical protein [Psittacicella hinzii]RIY33518.1 hypothetical protein CKF54_02605 [Psittacicella hinzii]
MLKKLITVVSSLALASMSQALTCQLEVKSQEDYYNYQFVHVPSCNLNIATRDYVVFPAYKGFDLNLSTGVVMQDQVARQFFTPLLVAKENDLGALKNFASDYYNTYLAYAPQAKYAFVIADYLDYGQQADLNDFTTTSLFINQKDQVSFTTNHVKALTVADGDLWLAPEKTVAILVVDYLGVTNQSGFTILLHNQNKEQKVKISTSLNTYMDALLAHAQEQSNKGNGSSVSITNGKGDVVISGGTIKAGNVNISGGNVSISNTNINADQEINLTANERLEVRKSELNAPEVNSQAPQIVDDGSLSGLMSQYQIPRIVGIFPYFEEILSLDKVNASRPLIDPFLAQGKAFDLTSQEQVEKAISAYVSNYSDNSYLLTILPSYSKEVLSFYNYQKNNPIEQE